MPTRVHHQHNFHCNQKPRETSSGPSGSTYIELWRRRPYFGYSLAHTRGHSCQL
jgi:hypothetical protein